MCGTAEHGDCIFLFAFRSPPSLTCLEPGGGEQPDSKVRRGMRRPPPSSRALTQAFGFRRTIWGRAFHSWGSVDSPRWAVGGGHVGVRVPPRALWKGHVGGLQWAGDKQAPARACPLRPRLQRLEFERGGGWVFPGAGSAGGGLGVRPGRDPWRLLREAACSCGCDTRREGAAAARAPGQASRGRGKTVVTRERHGWRGWEKGRPATCLVCALRSLLRGSRLLALALERLASSSVQDKPPCSRFRQHPDPSRDARRRAWSRECP